MNRLQTSTDFRTGKAGLAAGVGRDQTLPARSVMARAAVHWAVRKSWQTSR